MRLRMRSAIPACAAAISAILTGCGGGASTIKGKVIRGDISFLVVVEASDPRLRGDGLPGAQVQINASTSRGGALLAESTSDARGNVSLAVRDSAALLRPAEFSAELNGYARTSSVMSIPAADKRLLVILKPGGASTPK